MIYFIQARESRFIKIGHSNDVDKRFASMSIDNHEDLGILGTIEGGHCLEQRVHKHLLGHRHRGEWFKPSDAVLSFIDFAVSASADQIETELAIGVIRRDEHLRTLAIAGEAGLSAVQSAIRRLIDRHGYREVARVAEVPFRAIIRCAEGANLPATAAVLLRHEWPADFAIFDLVTADITGLDRSELEEARDAIEAVLSKLKPRSVA